MVFRCVHDLGVESEGRILASCVYFSGLNSDVLRRLGKTGNCHGSANKGWSDNKRSEKEDEASRYLVWFTLTTIANLLGVPI